MTLDCDVQAGSSAREAAALEAVLQMKVRLDDAREALRDERQANKRLTNMLAAVVAELKAAHARSDRLDNIAEGYSEALAQLIIPDGPRGASELPTGCVQERSTTSPARAVARQPQALAALGCGSSRELCEVGGSSPVDFRHRVGVVPQCGRSAAAMAKTRRGVTQVEPRREQLARRVASAIQR